MNVKHILPSDLPENMNCYFNSWHKDFDESITQVVPFEFHGEDKTIKGFSSTKEFKAWFGQPPGKPGQPWCDERFYIRELTWLSKWCCPDTIVEFGTDLGIGTCLLQWLNPRAIIHTVDISDTAKMPTEYAHIGEVIVPSGYLSKYEQLEHVAYHRADSRIFHLSNVDLCFIDASHAESDVFEDSCRAWENRNSNRRWVIIWHDYVYNDEIYGLRKAIGDFANKVSHPVWKLADSGTVWMYGEP